MEGGRGWLVRTAAPGAASSEVVYRALTSTNHVEVSIRTYFPPQTEEPPIRKLFLHYRERKKRVKFIQLFKDLYLFVYIERVKY